MKTHVEIKKGLTCAIDGCLEPEVCERCPYNIEADVMCHVSAMANDALALIERLESERDAALAKVPKWISVEEHKPKGFVSVQVYMTDAGDFPSVREGYYVDEDRFYIPALHEFHPVSHWKPFDEPPKEEDEE